MERCWNAGRAATLAATCLAVAAVFAASTVAVAFGAGSRASAVFGAVGITRDRAGIPHIVASNFTALGYGEGYAFAQDNLCTFANDVVTLEGERSRYFGFSCRSGGEPSRALPRKRLLSLGFVVV